MPRTARVTPGGMPLHVLNRGVGRMRLFLKEADFEAFERIIEKTLESWPMRICAYCLMSNHWHFVLCPERDGDLAAFMQKLTITHVRNWQENRRRVGYGHLYQGRYKSFPMESDEHFCQVVRYVERNALRANLIQRAEDWHWSSLWRRVHGSAEARIRKAVFAAVVRVGPSYPAIRKLLASALGDARPEVREAALRAAGELIRQMKLSVKDLLPKRDSPHGPVPIKVVLALSSDGPKAKQAVAKLIATLKRERDSSRRLEIIWSLRTIAPIRESTAEVLLESLNSDPSKTVRFEVVQALGELGPSARAAVPRLQELMVDESDVSMRMAALVSLKKIVPDNKPLQAVLDRLYSRLQIREARKILESIIKAEIELIRVAKAEQKRQLIKALRGIDDD